MEERIILCRVNDHLQPVTQPEPGLLLSPNAKREHGPVTAPQVSAHIAAARMVVLSQISHPGSLRAESTPYVAQDLELAPHGEGPSTEHLPQTGFTTAFSYAVRVELGEFGGVVAPVEGAAVDDDAA